MSIFERIWLTKYAEKVLKRLPHYFRTNTTTVPNFMVNVLIQVNRKTTVNRGIKHDFPFFNIRKVLREVCSTFPRDLANVNE